MRKSTTLRCVALSMTLGLLAACKSTPPPEPPPPPPPPQSFNERLSADGLFAFGKATLGSAEGRAELDALAARLNDGRPFDMVHVIGHSDRIGGDAANVALSTKRANAVRDYLVSHGVPSTKITAVGRGSVEPIAECRTEKGAALRACLAPNRRVEVRVVSHP